MHGAVAGQEVMRHSQHRVRAASSLRKLGSKTSEALVFVSPRVCTVVANSGQLSQEVAFGFESPSVVIALCLVMAIQPHHGIQQCHDCFAESSRAPARKSEEV